ncbi:MAG TPA: HDOD domain-containing protein [Burkholderiaceae bacterium]|nr:HDOD domain-containing protein [Burkholderiaceae bacterium]
MNTPSTCAPAPPRPGIESLGVSREPGYPLPVGREPLALSTIHDLPALPAALLELLRVLGNDSVETGTLAAKISHDQALTAKTLRLANSSFYGVSRHVNSVTDAIAVLGLRAVRTLVTTAGLAGSFKPPTCEGFDFPGFWRHAIESAVGAKLVANAIGADGETAFTAGLLHDIGQLALASGFAAKYARVLALQAEHGIELCDAERALLGIDHPALGALLAERWHFPGQIVEAIGAHHARALPGDTVVLADIVCVADTLAGLLGLGARNADALPIDCRTVWAGAGLSAGSWEQILAQTGAQAQAICAALLP